jgi:N-acetyl-D-muramate 6-phosphate phosphatase
MYLPQETPVKRSGHYVELIYKKDCKTYVMIDAVIWDYDGTLVDTRQKNLDVTKEIVFHVLSKSYEEFPALLTLENYEKANARSANWRELYSREFLMNEKQTDYAGSLWTKYQLLNTSRLELYRGLQETIIELGKTYSQGIVSLNSHANIRNSLSHNNVQTYFNAIIGYEEVDFAKQKPDPDGLLKCITHLDLHASRGTIVYIGDHETDAHCAINTNQVLGTKRIVSIGALYEKEPAHHNWNYQPDHIALTTGDIKEIIQTII